MASSPPYQYPKGDIRTCIEAVQFLFNPESFIRDETVAEKFHAAFDCLPLQGFPEIVGLMQPFLEKRYSKFSEYSDSIKMLILKVMLSILKQGFNWPLELLTSLRKLPLNNGCKEVFIEFHSYQLANNENKEKINGGNCFMPIPIEWFEQRNIYLRQKFVYFMNTAQLKHPNAFLVYLKLSIKGLSSASIVTLATMLACDLSSDELFFFRSHLILSKLIEPKLILKHPELIYSLNFNDYLTDNSKKAGFYDSLIEFYNRGDDETKDKIALFLYENLVSNDPNFDGSFQLKVQPVNVFVKLFPTLRNDGKLNNEDLLEFCWNLVSGTNRYEPVELQLTIIGALRSDEHKLADEVSNSFLVDCMLYAVDDCEPKCFEKACSMFLNKNGLRFSLNQEWNTHYDLLRLGKNPLGCNTSTASLKDCIEKSCKSVHWDMRECACSVITDFISSMHVYRLVALRIEGTITDSEMTDFKITDDLPQLVSILMQDSNVYVLASVCNLLSEMCKCSFLHILPEEQIELFFKHCSSFCDDVVHATVLTTVNKYQDKLKSLVEPEFYKRSFESDLCSYETKALAARLSTKEDKCGTGAFAVADWLEQFLRDPGTDSALVEHIEVSIGRKVREVVDEREQKWCSFINVCEQIVAESEAVNVALDCY